MQLSKRLSGIAALVSEGNRIADVGCDHGYIPIHLIREKRISSGIAMDVNLGPLLKAQENIRANDLEGVIETRLSDGVEKLLPGEVDTIIIAGMGGNLMIQILERGVEVIREIQELILQPQSDIHRVRYYLEDRGFTISEEDMVYEDGKFYTIIKAIPGNERYEDPVFYIYGKHLLLKKHPVLLKYLDRRLGILEIIEDRIRREGAVTSWNRLTEIEQERQKLTSARTYYDR